jgi:hypothetical protein
MNKKPVYGDYVQGSPSNHPGVPVGDDKVPAWLAPNEFVVNQEATAMYGPQIEAMNNHGRAVQAQQGNSVPPMPAEAQYFEPGGLVNFLGSLSGQQAEVPAPQPTAQMAVPEMQTPSFIPPAGIQAPANDASIVRMAPYPTQVTAMPREVPVQANPSAPAYDMFSGEGFGNYANSIAQLESGGREDPYSIMGGSNNHYVGKYQLGADAISDASKFLGMENTPSREDVRKNPQLQERLFNAYTQVNHRTMEQLSDQYRNMDPTEQQRYLGYAHNQGAGGALEFMNTGVVGRDGFGTAGTNYMSAVARGQGANDWAPGDTSTARTTIPGAAPQAAPPGGYPGQVPEFEFDIPTSSSQPIGPQGGMPAPTPPPGFIPQGVSAQQGSANQVFQDPTFKMMADRSGLDVQGYWDSLHPDAKAQHTKRVNAGPAIYTDKSELDTMNLVGGNSSLAAIPGDFDMAQTAAGRSGSPMTPAVPAMDNTPDMPGVDTGTVTSAPGSMEVPSIDAQPIDPNAAPNAYKEYGELRMEADYDSQQELDRITLQLQTTSRDAPAYEFLQERRAALLSNLGRNDPTYTGSIIPTPEVLSTDILANKDAAMNADLAVATETKAIQDAGMRGDMDAVAAAEARLTAAHKQKSDAVLEEADMVKTREANALEDQARKNADIQSEIVEFDTAIANATTPEGVAALTAGRDAAIERGTVPAMAPAGQGENLPSIDTETAAALKSKPKADPAVVTAVTDKVDEAVVAAEAEGGTVPTNLTSKDAEVAGDKAATADPSAFSGALGAIKDFFGDMFDAKELKRMAILYLGARVTGASGGASLAFAGKSYLSRVDAKKTAFDTVAASDKYTKESVAVFKTSRDYSDLALKALPTVRTGQLKTFYDKNGNEVQAEKVKRGDNEYWVGGNGKQLNTFVLTETTPKDREDQIQKAMTGVEGMIGDLQEAGKDEETGKYRNKIMPSIEARKIAKWAVDNGVPPEEMGSVIQAAYADMENAKGKGAEATSLMPYIQQNVVRQLTGGNAGVFVVEPKTDKKEAVYVDAQKLSVLNKQAAKWLSSKPNHRGTTQELANTFYNAAISDWRALTPAERDAYNKGAGEGTNGFFDYAEGWLFKELEKESSQ